MKAHRPGLRACIGFAILQTVLVFPRAPLPAQEAFQPARPLPEHEVLKFFVGRWEGKTYFTMAPDQPPVENRASERNRMLKGGLWLVSQYQGEFLGAPFEGIGVLGYDPAKKKYVGTWVDSITPHLGISEGTYDKEKKEFTYRMAGRDPATGEEIVLRAVTAIRGPDRYSFELYMRGPDGKEFKSFWIEYTRVKKGKRKDAGAETRKAERKKRDGSGRPRKEGSSEGKRDKNPDARR